MDSIYIILFLGYIALCGFIGIGVNYVKQFNPVEKFYFTSLMVLCFFLMTIIGATGQFIVNHPTTEIVRSISPEGLTDKELVKALLLTKINNKNLELEANARTRNLTNVERSVDSIVESRDSNTEQQAKRVGKLKWRSNNSNDSKFVPTSIN